MQLPGVVWVRQAGCEVQRWARASGCGSACEGRAYHDGGAWLAWRAVARCSAMKRGATWSGVVRCSGCCACWLPLLLLEQGTRFGVLDVSLAMPLYTHSMLRVCREFESARCTASLGV